MTETPATYHSPGTNQAVDTRGRILDAAEKIFIKRGFAATSLRAIATQADVNLAATHYHFGSKKGLLAAVFHRRIHPINEIRLLSLKRLLESEHPLTVKSIINVFFQPFISLDSCAMVPGLVGRMYGEPDSLIKPIIKREFSDVAEQFQNALASVLPQVDREELCWRFHFMIGSMIQFLQFPSPLGIESSREKFIDGINQLIDYSCAGLERLPAQAEGTQVENSRANSLQEVNFRTKSAQTHSAQTHSAQTENTPTEGKSYDNPGADRKVHNRATTTKPGKPCTRGYTALKQKASQQETPGRQEQR